MADPFNDETQQKPIVRAINQKLEENKYPGVNDRFWESAPDRFVSRDSLLKGADVVEVVMSREQWKYILGWFHNG